MRADNPEHPHHDHGFGLGARDPEVHDTREIALGLGGDEHAVHADSGSIHHGGLGDLGHGVEHFGGHVEVGHLDQDFGQHHDGLHGLHDSIGLGFGGGDHEHSLHESLHESLHDHQDLGHDIQHHDPVADHHGLGDLFHHG